MDNEPTESGTATPANDEGGVGQTLRPTDALDSDDVRNNDGDDVVDPPEGWSEADKTVDPLEGESLDDKLAAERPDKSAADVDTADADPPADTTLLTDDQVDHVRSTDHGVDRGQIDGAPEDGDSFFPVVDDG